MAGSIPAGSTMKVFWTHKSLAIWYLIFVPMSAAITGVPTHYLNGAVRAIWWILMMGLIQALVYYSHREKCEEEHPEALRPKPTETLRIVGPSKFVLVQDDNGDFWILPGPPDERDTYRENNPRVALRGTVRWTWLSEADAEGVCREARKFINTRPWEPRQ